MTGFLEMPTLPSPTLTLLEMGKKTTKRVMVEVVGVGVVAA
jgi:hypothetical protein